MPEPLAPLGDPIAQLSLAYVPADRRAGLHALLALDEQFAHLVAAAREPTIAMMRLVWWRDAVDALDRDQPPPQPLLEALAREVIARGVPGAELARMEEGWSILLDPDVPALELAALHTRERGARLFDLAARLLGESTTGLDQAGRAWALAQLARMPVPADRREAAGQLARSALAQPAGRWPRRLRALHILRAVARADLLGGNPTSRRRFARAVIAGLTGT